MTKLPAPVPRLTVITLGVSDMRASIAFYEALGFIRKLRATGEAVAFFDTGGTGARRCFRGSNSRRMRTLPRAPAASGVSRHDAGLELQLGRGGRYRCWISRSRRARRC